MTASDPGPTPPNASPGRTPPPPSPDEFSPGALFLGLVVSLGAGSGLTIVAFVMAITLGSKVVAILSGVVPGVLFIIISRIARANGLAKGLLIGGCILTLLGGACGASMAFGAPMIDRPKVSLYSPHPIGTF